MLCTIDSSPAVALLDDSTSGVTKGDDFLVVDGTFDTCFWNILYVF